MSRISIKTSRISTKITRISIGMNSSYFYKCRQERSQDIVPKIQDLDTKINKSYKN